MQLCVSMLLQDMLQAALYVETDFEPHSVATSLDTASTVTSKMHVKPQTDGQLCRGNDPVAVSKMSSATIQCTHNSTLVSGTSVKDVAVDTATVAIDTATVFRLSQDEFNDYIDDLSFIDLPLHSELPHGSESSVVTSNCKQDADVTFNTNSSSSLVSDVISQNRCLSLSKTNLTERCDMNNMLQAVVSSKRKRKFPGPAGVLPKLVRNDVINVSYIE